MFLYIPFSFIPIILESYQHNFYTNLKFQNKYFSSHNPIHRSINDDEAAVELLDHALHATIPN